MFRIISSSNIFWGSLEPLNKWNKCIVLVTVIQIFPIYWILEKCVSENTFTVIRSVFFNIPNNSASMEFNNIDFEYFVLLKCFYVIELIDLLSYICLPATQLVISDLNSRRIPKITSNVIGNTYDKIDRDDDCFFYICIGRLM